MTTSKQGLATLCLLLPWAALAPLQAQADNLTFSNSEEFLSGVQIGSSGSSFSMPGVAYMTWTDYAPVITSVSSVSRARAPDGCCYVESIIGSNPASYLAREEAYFNDAGEAAGGNSFYAEVQLGFMRSELRIHPDYTDPVVLQPFPEPASYALMGLGLVALMAWRAKRPRDSSGGALKPAAGSW